MRRTMMCVLTVTLLALPALPAAADAPASCWDASPLPLNTWVTEPLSSADDVDWFKFTAGDGRVQVLLGDLPADYELHVRYACDSSFYVQANYPFDHFEEFNRVLDYERTYRVRIRSTHGESSPEPYALRVRQFAIGNRILSSNTWQDGPGSVVTVGEVLNNGARRRNVRVDASYYDAADELLGTASAVVSPRILKRGQRGSFRIEANIPAGYDHYRVSARTGTLTDEDPVGRLFGYSNPTQVVDDSVIYSGSLVNKNSFAITNVSTTMTLFGSRAQVINVDSAPTQPSTFGPNESAQWSHRFDDHHAATNAWRLSSSAKPATP